MRKIYWNKVTKDYWLKEIPNLILILSSKYHFYWSKMYHNITKDPETLIKSKKDWYSHKMCLYRTEKGLFFFVIYCKNKVDVYYLEDNYLDSLGKVNYFIKKWAKHYEQDEYEEILF